MIPPCPSPSRPLRQEVTPPRNANRSADRLGFGAHRMQTLSQVSQPPRLRYDTANLSLASVYPPRIIRERDEHPLHVIAIGAMLSSPRLAAALLDELSRAAIRPDAAVPSEIIGLGSTAVCFESDGPRSRYHRAEIVAPEEAEPGLGRVSVLTDLGAALIGLAQQQSIIWRHPRRGPRQLAVLEVRTPELHAQPVPTNDRPEEC